MADRFMRWYRSRSTRADFFDQVEFFSQHGIQIDHPSFGKSVVLDAEGGSTHTDKSAVADLVGIDSASINVQFWLSSNTDLTCFFERKLPNLEVQTYYLEGLTPAEREFALSVLRRFAALKCDNTIGYMVDVMGWNPDFDWDPFFEGQSSGRLERFPVYPDVLAVKMSNMSLLRDLNIPPYITMDKSDECFVRLIR